MQSGVQCATEQVQRPRRAEAALLDPGEHLVAVALPPGPRVGAHEHGRKTDAPRGGAGGPGNQGRPVARSEDPPRTGRGRWGPSMTPGCGPAGRGGSVRTRRRGRHERRPARRPLRRAMLLGLLSVSCLAVVALLAGVALLGSLPGVGDAQTRVAAILREHRARPVGLPLPTRVASSVVAVEDQRFYTHHGVDLRSVARLAWSGLRGGDLQDEGGSTIAQQLAKRVYTGDRVGLAVKLRQVGLAVKLERRYSKDEILGMYLDAAYFAAAEQRQRHVLDRLVAAGVLSRPEADAAGRRLAAEARRLDFRTVQGT